MTAVATIEPVRKHVIIEASQERVFQTFTRDIDTWWPRQHHIGTSPLKRAVLEPMAGGRWYSVCEDGSECTTGRVLAWDPPKRVVLAWQITAQWQYDPDLITEVEVTFTAEGPRTTRVDLEHRNLERYGVSAVEFRKSIDASQGWGLILSNFAAAVGCEE
ncbi:MAG: SRPBCC family protein [bacterium]